MNRGDLVETIYAWAWDTFPSLCAADRGYIAGLYVDLYIDAAAWGQA